ncbi:unnamed protein product [Periconia digitata]|uniref:Uncharacterized protein n=1 Tax=Periconia digitata TaxID=1303443 RepID=A0A9W4UED1_9PLEO|nr:unnamed protein product [Periconia digitata]
MEDFRTSLPCRTTVDARAIVQAALPCLNSAFIARILGAPSYGIKFSLWIVPRFYWLALYVVLSVVPSRPPISSLYSSSTISICISFPNLFPVHRGDLVLIIEYTRRQDQSFIQARYRY